MKKNKFIVPILSGLTITAMVAPVITSCGQSNGKVQVNIVGEATCDTKEVDAKEIITLKIKAKENKMLLNGIVIKHGNEVLNTDSYTSSLSIDKASISISIKANVVKGNLSIEVKTINKIEIYDVYNEESSLTVHLKGFSKDFLKLDANTASDLIGDSMVIPAEVEVIDDGAFFDEEEYISTIPNSVKGVTFGKFGETSQLNTISQDSFKMSPINFIFFPNTTRNIARHAFYGSPSLITVDLGTGIQQIGDGAFGNCQNLLGISIPTSIKVLGKSAFRRCKNLLEIKIDFAINDTNLNYFGDYAFDQISKFGHLYVKNTYSAKKLMEKYPDLIDYDWSTDSKVFESFKTEQSIEEPEKIYITGLTDEFLSLQQDDQCKIMGSYSVFTIPHIITDIGTNAFYTNGTSNLPAWVKAIDFDDTYNSKTGTFDPICKSIGANAFRGSSITYLYIPYSISKANYGSIGNEAFKDCAFLSNIDISNTVEEAPAIPPGVKPQSFVGVPSIGKIYYSENLIKKNGKSVESFKNSWKEYFSAASKNEAGEPSIVFDDNHWEFINSDEI